MDTLLELTGLSRKRWSISLGKRDLKQNLTFKKREHIYGGNYVIFRFENFIGPANPWRSLGLAPKRATGLSPGFQPWEPSK
jgi:hypothetical protein